MKKVVKKFYVGSNLISENEPPKCKMCGSELEYVNFNKVTKNIFRVTGCSNENCIAHNTKKRKILEQAIYSKEKIEEMHKNRSNSAKKRTYWGVNYWIKQGFSEEEAIRKQSEVQSKNSSLVKHRGHCDKETIIKKFGEENVNKFFREKSRYCVEYYTSRGYTEEEGKKKISELQSQFSKISNGDIDEVKKRSWRCPEYWMKISGYTLEEAKAIISDKQKLFSKEICIKKYGEIEGIKKWQERQDKWQESLHKSKNLHVGYSKVSQELFTEILRHYPNEEKDYIFFGSKNREFSIRENNINYIYDFTDLNKRKIIEFQGDIYHGNPLLFNENDIPNPFKKNMTSKNIWEHDELKKKIAEKNGFSILQIWENDYRNNKEIELKKILEFLELC